MRKERLVPLIDMPVTVPTDSMIPVNMPQISEIVGLICFF